MTNGHASENGFPEKEVDFDSLTPQEKLNYLRRNLQQLRHETELSKEQLQRARAELANFRKRTEEEYLDIRQNANRRLIVSLLPVIDELELAVNHRSEEAASESWLEGVRLIHRKACAILEAEGLTRIETVGAEFDPSLHEAVGVVDSDQPSGYVVDVVRNGYRLHDRVIQAAQVVVAR